jgi:hypothetical protein
MNSTSHMAAFATFLVIATATSGYAQQPQAIRGTIDKIDGGIVSIKQANGADVDVKLLDNAKVFGVFGFESNCRGRELPSSQVWA